MFELWDRMCVVLNHTKFSTLWRVLLVVLSLLRKILPLVYLQQLRWGQAAHFIGNFFPVSLCRTMILIGRKPPAQGIVKWTSHPQLPSLRWHIPAIFSSMFFTSLRGALSHWVPSVICDSVGNGQRNLPLLVSVEMTALDDWLLSGHEGLRSAEVGSPFFVFRSGAHTCTLHFNKRQRLKASLHWTQHSFMLRVEILSVVLFHPPERSVLEVGRLLVFFPLQMYKKKIGFWNDHC